MFFYLRPKNGRAEDQLQRKCETYVDLVPEDWARIRIEVQGHKARLYVNAAAQPTLLERSQAWPVKGLGRAVDWSGNRGELCESEDHASVILSVPDLSSENRQPGGISVVEP